MPAAKLKLLLMTVLVCSALATNAAAGQSLVPDVDRLPMDALGRAVRLDRELIVHTAETIGADATVPATRFSGNAPECQPWLQDNARTLRCVPPSTYG